MLVKTGCKCVGIIEDNISVYDKKGIDIQVDKLYYELLKIILSSLNEVIYLFILRKHLNIIQNMAQLKIIYETTSQTKHLLRNAIS